MLSAGVGTTVTWHIEVMPLPSAAVALIWVVPKDMATIFPLLSTVAIELFELDQLISLFVAVKGLTSAETVADSPTCNETEVGLRTMEETGVGTTVIAHWALISGLDADAAYIVALPTETAVTTPFSSTEATFELLEVQTMDLSEAFAGATVAESATVSVAFKDADALESVTLVTGMPCTLILQVAVTPEPSTAEQVMMTSPGAIADTRPFAETEAIAGLLLLHSTSLVDAKVG